MGVILFVRSAIFCLVLYFIFSTDESIAVSLSRVRQSVFKINAISQGVNYSQPWLPRRQVRSSGTGFYIGEGRILTNAHVVAQSQFLTVLRDGDDNPMVATIKFIAHDSDLAILGVDDPGYFTDALTLNFGGLPKLRREVSTVGYPKGGEQISVTEGVVSRIGFRNYVHPGAMKHLLVQVDSAINSGNSGGPVFQGQEVVGVAFQAYTQAENTGYIIPVPVIKRFLVDIEDGVYHGHPANGLITLQGVMANPALREYHGLKEGEGGVKVSHVAIYASTYGVLKKNDIILSINSRPIGVDGKLNFDGERVSFEAVFDLYQLGENVNFGLVRGKKRLEASVPINLARAHHRLGNSYPEYPRFDIFAGLVFTPLSRGYLKSFGRKWHKNSPLHLRYAHWYSRVIERFATASDIIVLGGRLPDPINSYASRFEEKILDKVNGVIINGLNDIESALTKGDEKFIVINFWQDKTPLVIPRKEALKRHNAILKKYKIQPRRWLHEG